MPEIRAVLFDLDGVVRHFDTVDVARIEQRHGLASGTIASAAFAPELLGAVTTGRMTRAAWVQRIGDAIGHEDAAAEWGRIPSRLDPETTAIADELRAAGIRTAILTNGTDTIPAEAVALNLTAHFDAVFNSAEIGWAKPDERAFRHALDALELPAAEVFFTDDSPDKLAGAADIGMPTYLFTGASGLRAALREAGVLT